MVAVSVHEIEKMKNAYMHTYVHTYSWVDFDSGSIGGRKHRKPNGALTPTEYIRLRDSETQIQSQSQVQVQNRVQTNSKPRISSVCYEIRSPSPRAWKGSIISLGVGGRHWYPVSL